ncbi:MAG: O-antigen ligase-related protein [Candidatus Uhrbacteria bacterium GW2011_GWE2_40_58]|nr:MAG: O-antigen ligase-related protein [Candidatus Uhrbacteria bacterium GW2011_GWF2_40_263]KKR67718.1 MAG: O-antigen ligase-related protein [Candidatus Uhrbacteria bacterium GW2011_GWE2_40_58]OGL93499.1 MAG: hypothetical protein A2239_02720 [Candidatus Uhrbacteria bacterium RIFOXYA2_FULL_40_9]OGL96632.1 MAG: hypothetical protein A2332_02680 [Candidatus Uhrbacteria bacterium RIFOXYB2_FULL_41_18]
MTFTRHSFANTLTYLILFLLPWQTQWIFFQATLNGEVWEYGKLYVSVVEVLILLTLLVRGRPRWLSGSWGVLRMSFIFLGTCLIASSTAWFSLGATVHVMHVLVAFALFSLLCDVEIQTRKVIIAFLLGLIIPSCLGWYQVLTGLSPAFTWFGLSAQDALQAGASVVETGSERLLRAYGSFPHPNIFGGYLAVGVLLLAWLAQQKRFFSFDQLAFITTFLFKQLSSSFFDFQKIRALFFSWFGRFLGLRLGLPLFALLLASTLVITFSRSAWLGLFLGIVVMGGFFLWFKIPFQKNFRIVAGCIFLALFCTTVYFWPAISTRVEATSRLENISLEERVSGYQFVDDVVFYNPVTGVGPEGYTVALSAVIPNQDVWFYQPVHNTFLLILSELGLIGFVAFLLWVNSIDLLAYRKACTRGGAMSMALGCVVLVIALFDHYPWSQWSGLVLLAFVFAMMTRFSLEER